MPLLYAYTYIHGLQRIPFGSQFARRNRPSLFSSNGVTPSLASHGERRVATKEWRVVALEGRNEIHTVCLDCLHIYVGCICMHVEDSLS